MTTDVSGARESVHAGRHRRMRRPGRGPRRPVARRCCGCSPAGRCVRPRGCARSPGPATATTWQSRGRVAALYRDVLALPAPPGGSPGDPRPGPPHLRPGPPRPRTDGAAAVVRARPPRRRPVPRPGTSRRGADRPPAALRAREGRVDPRSARTPTTAAPATGGPGPGGDGSGTRTKARQPAGAGPTAAGPHPPRPAPGPPGRPGPAASSAARGPGSPGGVQGSRGTGRCGSGSEVCWSRRTAPVPSRGPRRWCRTCSRGAWSPGACSSCSTGRGSTGRISRPGPSPNCPGSSGVRSWPGACSRSWRGSAHPAGPCPVRWR